MTQPVTSNKWLTNKQIMFEAGETSGILFDSKEISKLMLNLYHDGLEAMQVGGTRQKTMARG